MVSFPLGMGNPTQNFSYVSLNQVTSTEFVRYLLMKSEYKCHTLIAVTRKLLLGDRIP